MPSPYVLHILHISESDWASGAAQVARSLHESLRRHGHGSRMLVGRRFVDDPDVRPIKRNVAWRAADRAAGKVFPSNSLQCLFYPSSFGVSRDPWFREADVLQLHNLHGSYFSHSALPWLTRRKPAVWLVEDMWPLTGHVAYAYDCERWRHGCGNCPYLDEYPRLRRDTTAFLWRHKRRVYAHSNITFVMPSEWIAGLARQSPLLAGHEIRVIPLGIDVERWRPTPAADARARLGLPPGPRLVLLAAADLGERRKGIDLAIAALERLGDVDFEIVLAGRRPPELAFPRTVHSLGTVDDNERRALVYSAADVFVLPSRADNRSLAAIESLACGTPCVSFRVGGMPETVLHLETGYLAEPEDVAGLAEGVRTLLEDEPLRARVGRDGRAFVERELSLDLQTRRHLELYRELTESSP